MESHELKSLLRSELTRRTQSNPRYSLRAFARHLGISPTYLSLIINGKRSPNPKAIGKLALKLGIAPTSQAHAPIDYRVLSAQEFDLISNWYHHAILELINIPNLSITAPRLSQILGISTLQAQLALELLLDLKLIIRSVRDGKTLENQYELLAPHNTSVDNPLVAVARKNLQKQLLNLALQALDQIPIEARDHSSMTFAMDSKLLPVAKDRISKFRRELAQFLESSSKKDSVYTLNLALHPHFLNQAPSKPKESKL